jgi:hypothetical protein
MNFWQSIAEKIGKIVASILLLVGVGGQPAVNVSEYQNTNEPVAIITMHKLPESNDVVIKAVVPAKTQIASSTQTETEQPAIEQPEIQIEQPEIGGVPEEPPVIYAPIFITNPEPEPVVDEVPSTASEPLDSVPVNEPKVMEYTGQIISPVSIKGLGRQYAAREKMLDEMNYVYICLLIKDQDGNVIKDAEVKVITTDESQNKTINGTGTIANTYVDGQKIPVYCYPFSYEFRTPGDHKITFEYKGQSESVEFKGIEQDTR